jgi:hypothetical protein
MVYLRCSFSTYTGTDVDVFILDPFLRVVQLVLMMLFIQVVGVQTGSSKTICKRCQYDSNTKAA